MFYTIAAFPPLQVVDATGCGDTCIASYLVQRLKGATMQQAGEFGAAMATRKRETSGPFTGAKEQVYAVRNTQTRD